MTVTAQTSGQAGLPTPNSTKSFWHKEPSGILLGHQTTPSLPSRSDIVIVGSGISGACAAHFLRENEVGKYYNILMLEAREACWGATGRNGGHCQPLLYSRFPDVASFELRNYQTIKALVEKNDIPCEWKSLTGVHAYMDSSMFDAAVQNVKALSKSAPELAKLIKIVTKESQDPSLLDLRIPNAEGAFVQAHAASLWPYKLVSWILENLLSQNEHLNQMFNLQTNTPVTHLQKPDSDGGEWIVHTPRGMIATKHILLATNGYTSHLLPSFSDLIVPVRGEMSALLPPKAVKPSTSGDQPLEHSYGFIGHGKQNMNQDDYLIQRPFNSITSTSEYGGELMFGGGRFYAANAGLGVSDDSAIDPPAAKYLRQELNVVLDLQNDQKELEATHEWSGIMGYSRDNCPWVGEVKKECGAGGGKGIWVCAGFTGHGMPNTCLSAKAVIEMMCGRGEEDVDLPERYRINKERIFKARGVPAVNIADAGGFV